MSMYNINTKYKNYTAEDLLKDESFLYPDEKSEKYWKKLLDERILDLQEYELACFYIDSTQVQEEVIEDDEIIDLWENIEVANKSNLKTKRKIFFIVSSVAAGILCLTTLSLSYLFHINEIPGEETTLAMMKIEDVKAPNMDVTDIQLILSDEEAISFDEKEVEIAYNEEGIEINEKEIGLRKQRNKATDVPVFNQLIVPKGKRSTLTFNDGSKIWVNAGSRVVYPTKFEADRREIYIDGEAYFEVSPDTKRPFIVKSKEIQVEVLGTSFNVTAYETDSTQSVVLVNGSVKVNAGSYGEHLLSPNQMLACSANGPEIKKVNVNDFISWKTGLYQFRSEPLANILKRLSRYYGKEILFTSAVSNFKCSGKLDLRDDLEEVMHNISGTAPIKYELSEEKYIVSNL